MMPLPILNRLGERIRAGIYNAMEATWQDSFQPEAAEQTGAKSLYSISKGIDDGVVSALYGYDDVRVPLTTARTGPTVPDFVAFRDGLLQWRLSHTGTTEFLYFACQLPHGYAPGTELYPHVHYSLGANHADNSGAVVQFDLSVTAASVNEAFPAAQTINMTSTVAGADYNHQVAFSSSPLDGSSLTESSMLLCALRRGNTITGNPQVGAFVLEFDFHILMEKSGTDNPLPPYMHED